MAQLIHTHENRYIHVHENRYIHVGLPNEIDMGSMTGMRVCEIDNRFKSYVISQPLKHLHFM